MSRFSPAMISMMVVMCLGLAIPTAAWEAPKNGVYTEKQLASYIQSLKEYMELMKSLGKQIEQGKTGIGVAAVMAGSDEKFNAIIVKHGLDKEEFQWLGNQATAAYGALLAGEGMNTIRTQMADQAKKSQQDLEENQKRLVQYETALKNETRVQSKEDRENTIKDATEQQRSLAEELKQHNDEVKTANTEATKADLDAKTADGLAKNPPADVAKDDREEYIKTKQGEAETARTAVKEARDRETEFKKAVSETQVKLSAAAKRISNPELPQTDDEKTQFKQDTESGLASTKEQIKSLQEGLSSLKDTSSQIDKMLADQLKEIPSTNVDLMKKHMEEFKASWLGEGKK